MINWDKIYLVGIETLDNQHKELLEKLNTLISSIKSRDAINEIIKNLEALEVYIIKHFEYEELLMKENDYPKYSFHHNDHDNLKKDLIDLQKLFKESGISTLFVINFEIKLSDWWNNHILEYDKPLGTFLQQKSDVIYI